MKSAHFALVALLAGAFSSTAAVAQTRFCIGGDLDHLSSAERASCNASLAQVRAAATSLHAPDGWHFVVVCGTDGWNQYAAFSPRGEEAVSEANADTDLRESTTYLRQDRLQVSGSRSLRSVVAHEIAAAVLQTGNEDAIRTQLARWERESPREEASLR